MTNAEIKKTLVLDSHLEHSFATNFLERATGYLAKSFHSYVNLKKFSYMKVKRLKFIFLFFF